MADQMNSGEKTPFGKDDFSKSSGGTQGDFNQGSKPSSKGDIPDDLSEGDINSDVDKEATGGLDQKQS